MKSLLDRIKTKKTTSSEHESVVSRATFARSIQMEMLYLPSENKKVSFPNTLDSTGKLVQTNGRQHLNHELGLDNAAAQDEFGGASALGAYSYEGGGAGNKIMEYDVPPSRSKTTVGFAPGGAGGNHSSILGSKTTPLPSEFGGGPPLTGTTRPTRTGSGSELSSRGSQRMGISSNTDRSGTSRHDSTAGNSLLGTANVLIIRLKGEVHGLETTRNIIERLDTSTNERKNVMQEFIVPKKLWFIPPIGKRIDDPDIVAANSKPLPVLSSVSGRDAELRTMSEHVLNTLVKDILNAAGTRDAMQTALTNVNPQSISDPANKISGTYGLHYHEIMPKVSLDNKMLIEIQHAGYRTSVAPPTSHLHLMANMNEVDKLPSAWKNSGDELLLVEHDSFSMFRDDLLGFLKWLNVSPAMWIHVEASVYGATDSNGNVCIAKWIVSLSKEVQKELDRRVSSVKEDRLLSEMRSRHAALQQTVSAAAPTAEAEVVVSEGGENAAAAMSDDVVATAVEINVVEAAAVEVSPAAVKLDSKVAPLKLSVETTAAIPAKEEPSRYSQAFKDEEFLGIATDVIGDTLLNLFRDLVRPPAEELEDRSISSSTRSGAK